MYKDYINSYLGEVKEIAEKLDQGSLNRMIEVLKDIRDNKGRLFIIGVGGGAGHASHAVNDFRLLAGIEAYTPADNVTEITARTNDDGFHTIFSNWLKVSSLNNKDAVLVFSVGGGNKEKNISANIIHALDLAKEVGAKILGVVGRDGGHTAKVADACVVVPT